QSSGAKPFDAPDFSSFTHTAASGWLGFAYWMRKAFRVNGVGLSKTLATSCRSCCSALETTSFTTWACALPAPAPKRRKSAKASSMSSLILTPAFIGKPCSRTLAAQPAPPRYESAGLGGRNNLVEQRE